MGLKQTTTHKYIRDSNSVNIQRILMRNTVLETRKFTRESNSLGILRHYFRPPIGSYF